MSGQGPNMGGVREDGSRERGGEGGPTPRLPQEEEAPGGRKRAQNGHFWLENRVFGAFGGDFGAVLGSC